MTGKVTHARYAWSLSDQGGLIKPKAVRLSHTESTRQRRPGAGRKLVIALFLSAAAALVIALFFVVPQFIAPVTSDMQPSDAASGAGGGNAPRTSAPAVSRPTEPPPFEALLREQARTEAQDQLARFVELEIELRDAMQVESWAAAAYEGAKDLAHAGDESFVDERYAVAIASYREAADTLQRLIDEGHQRFASALAAALEAIDARDHKIAEARLAEAALVKPDHPDLQHALARAASLPEILALFREAHNQELAGQWDAALDTYGRIRALDPATPGTGAAVAAARERRSSQRLQSFLSTGFAHLANGRLGDAEVSFNRALAMDPGNGAALGGLQQVAEQGLVNHVEALQDQATAAAAGEDWPAAADAYQAILALDANIQFARAGLTNANAQANALKTLAEVVAAADLLSSDRRYASAQDTLTRARKLEPRGPKLAEKISQVEQMLLFYAQPVPVVLQSDNATEVLLSNVGPLGKFFEKRLALRPGAYTLVGSRDGCRDVRQSITVRTGMAPVDIRCLEVLAR